MLRLCSLLFVFSLAGCATMQVSWDYDAEADFSALQTFNWLPAPAVAADDPQLQFGPPLDSRLRSAVEAQLAGKDFRRDANDPDFLVTYHVAVDDRVSVTYLSELRGYGPSWSAGYHYRRHIGGYTTRSRDAVVSEYQVGTLIIDILRADSKQLLWRGTASAEVQPGSTEQAREKRIREAVQKILERFPPPQG